MSSISETGSSLLVFASQTCQGVIFYYSKLTQLQMTVSICIAILCFPDQFPNIKLTTNLLSKSLLEVCIRYAYDCSNGTNVHICCHDDSVKHIEKYLLELLTTNNLDLCDIKSSKTLSGCLQQIQWSSDVVFLNPFVISNIPLQLILQEYNGADCDSFIPMVDCKVVDKLEKLGGRPNFYGHDRLKWLIGTADDRICYAVIDDIKHKVHHSILNVFPKINFTRQYEIPPIMICRNWVFQWVMSHRYSDLHDVMMDLIQAQYNPHFLKERNILKFFKNDNNSIIGEALSFSTTHSECMTADDDLIEESMSLECSIKVMKKIKVLHFLVPITQPSYIFDLQFEENVFEYIKMVVQY
eukprot:NODE_33_length_32023_cov_0.217579.p9 type:complete len:354 gc:universal NODE_33_length_32023_cov_0.217579:9473-8412(-)